MAVISWDLKKWAELVQFKHSVFALPFALSMLVVVGAERGVTLLQVVFIVVAVVSARTAAMAYNRIADIDVDSQNPRTKDRHLPTGQVSIWEAKILLLLSCAVFILASYGLGIHCLVLSPLVLFVLLGYSWTKRFTSFSHFILGLSLGMAPAGVWWALVGTVDQRPIWLMGAVMLWVAGFDVLYSFQDVEFDRHRGLYSIPALVGIRAAAGIALVAHALTLALLFIFGERCGLGAVYFFGLGVFGLLIVRQYLQVLPAMLTRDNFKSISADIIAPAFFVNNGLASIVYFVFTSLDVLIRQ